MVTQKDVANLAGVSFITVSRVVNGENNVREETKQRVLDAIEKLGYAPTFAGMALNSGKCNSISILSPIPFFLNLRSYYLMQVLSGIEQACIEKDIDLMLNIMPEPGDKIHHDYLRSYRQKKVDGVIYIGFRKVPDELKKELALREIPYVVIGDRPHDKSVSWIDTDNFQAGYNTVNEMWKKGHRRIAFLGLKKTVYNTNISERERGFCAALKDLGADYDGEDYIIRTVYETTQVVQDVADAFKSFKEKPTAVFCCTDSTVPDVINAIELCGKKVPDDVSIVGFDGYINTTNYKFSVATNTQPLREMGFEAAQILFRHIEDKTLRPETEILPVNFTDGSSLVQLT